MIAPVPNGRGFSCHNVVVNDGLCIWNDCCTFIAGNVAASHKFHIMNPTKNQIELALHWMRELRPEWKWAVTRLGPANITIKGEHKLIAPGAQVFWMTPAFWDTGTMEVFGTRATVHMTIEHRDIRLWNETAPEMVKFLADDAEN